MSTYPVSMLLFLLTRIRLMNYGIVQTYTKSVSQSSVLLFNFSFRVEVIDVLKFGQNLDGGSFLKAMNQIYSVFLWLWHSISTTSKHCFRWPWPSFKVTGSAFFLKKIYFFLCCFSISRVLFDLKTTVTTKLTSSLIFVEQILISAMPVAVYFLLWGRTLISVKLSFLSCFLSFFLSLPECKIWQQQQQSTLRTSIAIKYESEHLHSSFRGK